MRRNIMLLLTFVAMTALGTNNVWGQEVPTNEQEPPLVVVEEEPVFPGGMEALMNYLSSNIQYPKKARKDGVEGMVFARFVIEKDGSVTNIRIMRDPGCGLGDEVVRVLKDMPKWTPGMVAGEPVRSEFTLPVTFKLTETNKISRKKTKKSFI